MAEMELIKLCVSFFSIAVLYSMVGFGGGSSYLAILTFFMVDQYLIRSNALVCNIAVVSIGSATALLDGSLKLKKALSYVALSVPAAYLGAMVELSNRAFFLLLSFALVLSSIAMFWQSFASKLADRETQKSGLKPLGMGGAIGFLSGMVGIGGGIFLSPIVNLLKMETAKTMAGIASFFIWVNSLAGIGGLAQNGNLKLEISTTTGLVISVIVGGLFGARIKSSKLQSNHIRLLTAVLVLAVGIRLFIKYL